MRRLLCGDVIAETRGGGARVVDQQNIMYEGAAACAGMVFHFYAIMRCLVTDVWQPRAAVCRGACGVIRHACEIKQYVQFGISSLTRPGLYRHSDLFRGISHGGCAHVDCYIAVGQV